MNHNKSKQNTSPVRLVLEWTLMEDEVRVCVRVFPPRFPLCAPHLLLPPGIMD